MNSQLETESEVESELPIRAIHEAGHALVYSVLGARIARVSILPDEDGLPGFCDPYEIPFENYLANPDPEARPFIRAHAVIEAMGSLAGMQAQGLQAEPPWSLLSWDDVELALDLPESLDSQGLLDALALYRKAGGRGRGPDPDEGLVVGWAKRSEALLCRYWHGVEALAELLLEHGALDEDAVGRCVDAALGHERDSYSPVPGVRMTIRRAPRCARPRRRNRPCCSDPRSIRRDLLELAHRTR